MKSNLKQTLYSLSILILLFACKKESDNEKITIDYNVGDNFSYSIEVREIFDDTTFRNNDSTFHTIDTGKLTIEKDTLIENQTCLKLIYTGRLAYRGIEYVLENESGLYLVAHQSPNEVEIEILPTPKLKYPSNMKIGMHWGESPDGKNKRQEVYYFEEITTNSSKINSLKTKINFYEEDWIVPPTAELYEYLDNKGIVKEYYYNSFFSDIDEFKGRKTFTYEIYRF